MIHEDLSTQIEYLYKISHTFDKFVQKSSYVWNVRCPYCGDSTKSRSKMRGYVGVDPKTSLLAYSCHNCETTANFRSLLKHQSISSFEQYQLQTLDGKKKQKNADSDNALKELFAPSDPVLVQFPTLDRLPSDHIARKYADSRKLPRSALKDLYFCDSFGSWIGTVDPKYVDRYPDDQERILIPFRNRQGKIVTIQGRAFGNVLPKYATAKLSDEQKIYGIDKVDLTKKIVVVEGPFDSMFLPNAVASADSNLSSDRILNAIGVPKDQLVLVYDNQPRNRDIVRLVGQAINKQFNVVIWPRVAEKDINDLVLAKHDPIAMINRRTFLGIEAELEYAQWRQV